MYKNRIVLLLLFVFFSCCKNKSLNIPQDETMIEINNVCLPKSKIDNIIPVLIEGYKQENKVTPSIDTLKKMVHKYCADLYFAADAYKKSFDTINEVQEAYFWDLQFLATDIYKSILLDSINNKEQVSKEDIRIAFMRRKFIYNVDVIQFRSESEAKELLGEDIDLNTINKKSFNDIYVKLKFLNPAFISSVSIRWPFLQFHNINDKIFLMSEGEIIGPIMQSTSIYLVRLNSIEEIYQIDKEDEHAILKEELKEVKRKRYFLHSFEEILEQSKIKYFEKNLIKYFEIDTVNTKINSILGKESFVIAEYLFDDKYQKISANQLYDFSKYNNIKISLNTIFDLRELVNIYVIHQYYYHNALQMNVMNELQYRIQKEVILYNILIQYYLKKEILESINISNEEICRFYNDNKQLFREAEVAYVTEISFDSRLNALHALSKIQEAILANNIKILQFDDYLSGVNKVVFNKAIKYNNEKFSPVEINTLFSIQKQQCTYLMEKEGQFSYFIKEGESGQRIQSLEEVQDEIKKQIEYEKFKFKKDSILKLLANKYIMNDYIDYEQFAN